MVAEDGILCTLDLAAHCEVLGDKYLWIGGRRFACPMIAVRGEVYRQTCTFAKQLWLCDKAESDYKDGITRDAEITGFMAENGLAYWLGHDRRLLEYLLGGDRGCDVPYAGKTADSKASRKWDRGEVWFTHTYPPTEKYPKGFRAQPNAHCYVSAHMEDNPEGYEAIITLLSFCDRATLLKGDDVPGKAAKGKKSQHRCYRVKPKQTLSMSLLQRYMEQ